MRFINNGESIKIRMGSLKDYKWITLKKGEKITLPVEAGRNNNLDEIKTTSGRIGTIKVSTKQIEIKNDLDFYKELIKINGIGKNTAQDIVNVYPIKSKLVEVVKAGEKLPFRNDIEIKLREYYG